MKIISRISLFILVYMFGYINMQAQYEILVDTVVVSNSLYYEDDGVVYTILKIPIGDSILDLSKKELSKLLHKGIVLEAQSIEMVVENNSVKVPHECIQVKVGDQCLQHSFPDIAYQVSKNSIKKNRNIIVINNVLQSN